MLGLSKVFCTFLILSILVGLYTKSVKEAMIFFGLYAIAAIAWRVLTR